MNSTLKSLCRMPSFWGWGLCSIAWKALLAPYAQDGPLGVFVSAIVLLAVAFLWARMKLERYGRMLLNIVAAFGVAGTLLVAGQTLGLGAFPFPLVVVASCTNLCVTLFLALAWSAVFSRVPMAADGLMLGASYFVAFLVFEGLNLLPAQAQSGASLALIPLSVACALLCWHRLDAAEVSSGGLVKPCTLDIGSSDIKELIKTYPWRLVLVLAFFAFAVGINRVHSTVCIDVISAGVAGVLLVLCTFVSLIRVNAFQLYKALIPVMLACLLIGILSGASTLAAQIAINVSYAFAQMLLILLLCDKAYRFRVPIVLLYGIGRACLSVAAVAGTLSGQLCALWLGDGSFWGTELIYGVVLLGSFAAIASWITGSDYRTAFAVPQTAQPENDDAEIESVLLRQTNGVAPVDVRTQLLQSIIEERCEALAVEYRLSKREAEILVLLGWGKSAKRIEEMLVLSANTVKTHVRHIYSKLGIHSRTELDALIDVGSVDGERI